MSTLEKLQQWYFSRCDGDWEHDCGFTIAPIDNPGWMIEQDLEKLEIVRDAVVSVSRRTDSDWLEIVVRGDKLLIAGGPLNLTEMIDRFLELVGASE